MDHLQGVDLVAICGAASTTPLRAMEALLGFPPLSKFIIAQAMNCCTRLSNLKLWYKPGAFKSHSEIEDRLKEIYPINLPNDRIAPVFSFHKPFSTVIGDREAWCANTTNAENLLKDHWFTDGSR